MSQRIAYALLISLSLFAPYSFAQGGWQGIPWGATHAQIARHSKLGLEKIEQPKNDSDTLYEGYRINSYKIGQYTYKVILIMSKDKDRLAMVTILPQEDDLSEGHMRSRASELEGLLSERYGPAVFKLDERGKLERTWKTKDAHVRLLRINHELASRLFIFYKPPSSSEKSKL